MGNLRRPQEFRHISFLYFLMDYLLRMASKAKRVNQDLQRFCMWRRSREQQYLDFNDGKENGFYCCQRWYPAEFGDILSLQPAKPYSQPNQLRTVRKKSLLIIITIIIKHIKLIENIIHRILLCKSINLFYKKMLTQLKCLFKIFNRNFKWQVKCRNINKFCTEFCYIYHK